MLGGIVSRSLWRECSPDDTLLAALGAGRERIFVNLSKQAGFRKGRGPRDQIANICWIMGNATEFQKNIYFCFTDYAKS